MNNLIDQYSILHFIAGIIAYFLGAKLLQFHLLHILYKIYEDLQKLTKIVKRISEHTMPNPNDIAKTVVDLVFGVLGWLFAYMFFYKNRKISDIEMIAINDLAKNTKSLPKDIKVIKSKKVTWRDGSLGCPRQGEVYTQALVDGHEVLLEHNNVKYDYRIASKNNFKVCNYIPKGSDVPITVGYCNDDICIN